MGTYVPATRGLGQGGRRQPGKRGRGCDTRAPVVDLYKLNTYRWSKGETSESRTFCGLLGVVQLREEPVTDMFC